MKKIFTLFICLSSLVISAAPGDTTWVNSHNKTDLTWYGTYKDTANFPDGSKTYHKILMYYTMGCATGGCSDWDYTTRVLLMNGTGKMDSTILKIDTISTNPIQIDTTWKVFEVTEPFELSRVITPYGNALSNNWSHDFVYDVTDLFPLLQNEKAIHVQYQGWSSGFSATIRFAFIEGTPSREVISVENIYHGKGDYITMADFESNHLPQKTVQINAATTGLLLRTNFSGHGFVNSLNCAEFCKKDYYVNVGTQRVATQAIWRDDCGLNPIWPQAGTWLYDRANWCPGDKSLFRTHDLSAHINGSTMDIDIDIEPYTYTVPPNETPAGYNYTVQLIQYKDFVHQNDVELERIIAPSSEDENARVNPICAGAIVKIRNKGGQNLTSCEIGYGMDGGVWKTFNWTGNLAPMESAVVELPFAGASDWMSNKSKKVFIAIADKPNGQKDEYPLNNWYQSDILFSPVFPADIKLTVKTNSAGNETHWKLTRLEDGAVISSGDNLGNNTTTVETFSLQPGCYLMHLQDRGKDGFIFPAAGNPDGTGYARFQNNGGSIFFHTLNPNFGTEIKQYFTVGYGIGLPESQLTSVLEVYPNPSNGQIKIEVLHVGSAQLQLQLIDMQGKKVYERSEKMVDEWNTSLNLQHFPKGIYSLKMILGNEVQTRKIVID